MPFLMLVLNEPKRMQQQFFVQQIMIFFFGGRLGKGPSPFNTPDRPYSVAKLESTSLL